MNKLLSLLLLLILSLNLFSQQTGAPEPPYRQFPTVPPFKFMLTDSVTYYSKEDLPSKKAVLLMLFSPDCDHCRHQTDSILANMEVLKKIQIVMASVLPLDRIKKFQEEYQLDRFPNMVVGRDYQFLLPGFFQTHSLPSMGLYDRKKNLIEVTEGTLSVQQLLAKFNL
ncbi:MAG: TlpA family protein disulfide reductase [Chitinophagaceae bacterium]|jgi:thioredoxin-related protein